MKKCVIEYTFQILPNTVAAYRKVIPQFDIAIRRKDVMNGIAVHNKVFFLPNLLMRQEPDIPVSNISDDS